MEIGPRGGPLVGMLDREVPLQSPLVSEVALHLVRIEIGKLRAECDDLGNVQVGLQPGQPSDLIGRVGTPVVVVHGNAHDHVLVDRSDVEVAACRIGTVLEDRLG